MRDTVTDTIRDLSNKLQSRLSPGTPKLVRDFAVAVGDSQNVTYAGEPLFSIAENPAEAGKPTSELLVRVTDEGQRLLPTESSVNAINASGGHADMDHIVVLLAMHQAIEQNTLPVSINISSRNVREHQGLIAYHELLQENLAGLYRPDQVTFELLEDDPADNPCHDALLFMRELGYKFAIDDLSHDRPHDTRRLSNLGPYTDIVKIDGKTLEALRAEKLSPGHFRDFISQIRQQAPAARVLCEWVNSPREAFHLQALYGIELCQGRNLPHQDKDFRDAILRPVQQEFNF